ncbi:host specificity factor TipJ family phage tail protein [Pseudomonas sp. yb_1]|uniref:host specificity factor TipJ family phage tail protein n=1 Tax=Pseudomonas sp. yb_1 TaxID=3367217 RepID=UPI00370AC33B
MIEIYPNKLASEPAEVRPVETRQSLLAWFHADGLPKEVEPEALPLSVFVNGDRALPTQWTSIEFGPEDQVQIYREPKGTDPFSITFALVFGAKAVLSALMPKMPSLNSRSTTKRGNDLGLATVKGNQVKLNALIREIAGRQRPYPDYALPPNRYFDDPRSQWIEMLLVVGKGSYEIPAGSILIGDTPVISLGGDAQYTLYEPGANLSSETAAKWWHSAPEVGATSTGTAGIELKATYAVAPVPTAQSYQFAAKTITVPAGAGQFPNGWAAGMIVRIEVGYPYDVIDGGAGRDIIRGNLDQIAPYVGMPIEIIGANAGNYTVATYTPGVGTAPDEMTLDWSAGGAATGLTVGTGLVMGIGFRGLRYRITAAGTASISVERMNAAGDNDATWAGFDALTTSSAALTLDGSTQEGDWSGAFPACPAGTTTTRIAWDIFFPQGLALISSSGSIGSYSVTVELQYRDIATAGSWTSVKKVYQQSTLDQLGFTEYTDLPSAMRPEVRVRRIGAKNQSTQVANTIQWYGLRANLPAPTSYEGVTLLALRVKGGNRIASQSESQVSVIATRKLRTRRDGAWTDPEPTRDIAAWIGYVAQSVGYSVEDGDSDIDLDELDRLQEIWTARGDYYDRTIDSASTVKACMIEALQAGFSELTIDRGLIRPVRDEPRGPDFDHMYNPQVMTKPLKREAEHVTADDFDGVDVEYMDGTTWQVETIECRLPGDLGLRVEKVKVEGISDEIRAWRYGMRRRRQQVYQRKRYSFSTELDALNSGYLDYALLGDTTPGYGQSAMLKGYAPLGSLHMLVSSERFDWSAGGEHWVALRRPDGSASGPYVATRIDDYRLTIPSLDFVPVVGSAMDAPVLQFGPKAKFCYPALIKEVNPSGTVSCNVTAVNYDARVYLDDDNFPPA